MGEERRERRWRVGMGTLGLLFPNHGVLAATNSLPMPPINPKFQLLLKGSLLLLLLVLAVMLLPLISITTKRMHSKEDLPILGI